MNSNKNYFAKKLKLTQTRIRLAYAIAIIVDTGKFPIFAVEATGFLAIPGETADFLMDCFVAAAAALLLGFNRALRFQGRACHSTQPKGCHHWNYLCVRAIDNSEFKCPFSRRQNAVEYGMVSLH